MKLSSLALYSTILIPTVVGFTTSMFCNVGKEAGESVKFRPPSYVFGIAWTILYICLGLSWFFSNKDGKDANKLLINIMFSLVILALTMWLVVYACGKNKLGGIYVLLLSVLMTLGAYTVAPTTLSKLLICPLLIWLMFATLLNIFEVQLIK
tara:strand:+ start:994 stop:1449 length:456 start_codon:yes stop_codon:yes gene_type:complete